MKKHARRDLIRAVPIRSLYESANSASFFHLHRFSSFICLRDAREKLLDPCSYSKRNRDQSMRDESRILELCRAFFFYSLRKRISTEECQFYFIISSL